MPRKNSLKVYVQGGYYHIFNRGVEKRKIFLDERDYRTFLYFLKIYLSPVTIGDTTIPATELVTIQPKPAQTLFGQISLLSFCLMPNHFHLLVKQEVRDGITKLMNRIGTNFGMYFNKRYNRVGPLFQGVYKAVLVKNDAQLLHLSRYIHLNPYEINDRSFEKLVDYPYSSYGDYLGIRNTKWIKTQEILAHFKSKKIIRIATGADYFSYQSFVESFKGEYDLTGLTLEG